MALVPRPVRRLALAAVLMMVATALGSSAGAAVIGTHDGRLSRVAPVPSAAEDTSPGRFLLVRVDRDLAITARPGGGGVVGTWPAGSRFYGTPSTAWVRRTNADGRFGLVDVPYAAEPRSGWIRLRGLERSWTRVRVIVDLSEHRLTVRGDAAVVLRVAAGTGAQASPTPTGRFVVTDRVAFPAGGVLGTFAFGISGIQSDLPAGWTGGDQLAIHGTNAPTTIGRSASAGCLRVSEAVLAELKPLLQLGTPVIVRP
ncbi:MAG TPA: L,D-transpeptidase [Actinomycetota bacterium]|nr:L,D-transpeptidase [Actinomycetota bacterium]